VFIPNRPVPCSLFRRERSRRRGSMIYVFLCYMYMNICVYICIYTYMYIYTYIYVYTDLCIYICIHRSKPDDIHPMIRAGERDCDGTNRRGGTRGTPADCTGANYDQLQMMMIHSESVKSSTGHTHTQQQTNHSPLTRHTNTERATAQRQRRLIVEVVVAAPKLPPSAALLLSILLHTRGTGHLPERTTRTGAIRD